MSVEDFVADQRLAGLSENTVAAYARLLNKAPFELPGDVRTVRNYLAERSQTVKPQTVICEIRAFKRYAQWWADENSEENPLQGLRYPKQRASVPGHVVEDEAVRRALGRLKCWSEGRWNVRDYALIRLLEYTGMRRSEIARMVVDDLDFEHRRILIPVTKNGAPRQVPISKELEQALRRWLRWRENHGLDSDWLWIGTNGAPLKGDSISGVLDRISKRYGITPPLRTHQFRRRFATEWVRQGGTDDTLMLLAGWKSPRMPAQYRAARAGDLAIEQYHRIFDADGPVPHSKQTSNRTLRRRAS
jgi:site-specific recombinase XerD